MFVCQLEFTNIMSRCWCVCLLIKLRKCDHSCCRSCQGFPARIFHEIFNFLQPIIRCLRSFSARIRLIAVTSTRRLSRPQINPRFSYKLLHKLRVNFVQGLQSYFNAFVTAVFESPILPNLYAVSCAFLVFSCYRLKRCYFILTCPPFVFLCFHDSPVNQFNFIFLYLISTFCTA